MSSTDYDDDDEAESLQHLQQVHWLLDHAMDEEINLGVMGALAYVAYGAEEARRLRSERRSQRRLYLRRGELLKYPQHSTPWHALYNSRSDRAFITTMGIDVETFHVILQAGFEDSWNHLSITRNDVRSLGRPRLRARSLNAAGALGLCLHYLNSTMHDISLCQIFAVIPTTVSRYVTFSLKLLLDTLKSMVDARIQWLRGDEFEQRNQLIVERHPLLEGAFGVLDGLNLPVQTSTDPEIENATYNGWLKEHFISNIIAFCSQGEIIHCRLNAPGSWHDSRVAVGVYRKLEHETPPGYYLVADTAFPRGTARIAGKIRVPLKSRTVLPTDAFEREELLRFDRELLSLRQAAEWGMGALQGSFGRLRVPLQISDEDRRSDLLEICCRLFNLRTRRVGYNQIRTVYLPIWKEGEQERVWRDFEKMLFCDQRQMDRVSRFHLVVEEV